MASLTASVDPLDASWRILQDVGEKGITSHARRLLTRNLRHARGDRCCARRHPRHEDPVTEDDAPKVGLRRATLDALALRELDGVDAVSTYLVGPPDEVAAVKVLEPDAVSTEQLDIEIDVVTTDGSDEPPPSPDVVEILGEFVEVIPPGFHLVEDAA